jgi:hypothetical protein
MGRLGLKFRKAFRVGPVSVKASGSDPEAKSSTRKRGEKQRIAEEIRNGDRRLAGIGEGRTFAHAIQVD